MTQLESILSRLVHFPVKLIGVTIPCTQVYSKDCERFVSRFVFDTVVDQDAKRTTIPDDDDIPFCDLDCSECDMCDDKEEDEAPMMWGIPDVSRIIFNDPATIVFWEDGTKTVVKAMDCDRFDKYAGFMAACMKKMFGSTSRAKAIMAECGTGDVKSDNPKQKYSDSKTISIDQLIHAFVDGVKQAAEEKAVKDETFTG